MPIGNFNLNLHPEVLERIRNSIGAIPGTSQPGRLRRPRMPGVPVNGQLSEPGIGNIRTLASGLPPGLTQNATGEIIPASPTSGARLTAGAPTPVSRPTIPANQPVTINQPAAVTTPTVPAPLATTQQPAATAAPTIPTPTAAPTPSLPAAAPVTIDPAQQAAINAVPSGLIGAEQALMGGAEGSTAALLEALGVSRADIEGGGVSALQRLEDARGGIATGTQQSIEDIMAGKTGVTTLEQGKAQGLEVLNRAFDDAVDPITGFIDPGRQAQTLQAALTGALGPEAQRAAIDNFQNDPSIQFATEEAERSLLRNTAAIGGLGGGNVRKELQRQAIGRAQKAFNDRISQLGQVAATGLGAAATAGGLEAERGITGVDLIGRTATGAANIESQITELTQSGAFAEADVAGQQAQIERAIGQDLATLEATTGLNVAQTVQNLGSASAELRSQAGRDLAAAIASTTSSLAAQQAGEGAGIADIVGTNISNIANTLLQEGLLDAASDEQLAVLLGNLTVGQGTTAANIAANIGQIEAAGILGTNKAVQTGIAGLVEMLGKKDGGEP